MPKLAKVTNPNVYGSQTLISQLLGISRGKFQRLEEKGVFVRKNYDGVHPLYLVRECIQSYFDVTFAETTDEDGELLDPVAEKAKLDKERRVKVELENAKVRGELLDASEVRDAFADVAKTIVNALASLPDRLEREVQMEAKQLNKVEEIVNGLRRMVYEKLSGGSVE